MVARLVMKSTWGLGGSGDRLEKNVSSLKMTPLYSYRQKWHSWVGVGVVLRVRWCYC